MTFIIAEIIGTDVSSRTKAAQLRDDVVRAANDRQPVQLNFSGVRTISESFADELFGVLVADRGDEWFREHVKVKNVGAFPRKTILEAIAARKACGA
jgi:hypothetical protein